MEAALKTSPKPSQAFTPLHLSVTEAIRLVRHEFPFADPSWFFPVIFMCLEMASWPAFSTTFTQNTVRLAGLQCPRVFFLPFLKMGVTFAFPSLGTSSHHHSLLQTETPASFLSSHGCTQSVPMDLGLYPDELFPSLILLHQG